MGNDRQFVRFAAVLGHSEWAHDDRFSRNRDRVRHRELIDDLIQQALATRPRDEWMPALADAGIPAGPIHSVADALSDDHTLARGMVTTIEHPSLGALAQVGVLFRPDATPASIRRPPIAAPDVIVTPTARRTGNSRSLDGIGSAPATAQGIVDLSRSGQPSRYARRSPAHGQPHDPARAIEIAP